MFNKKSHFLLWIIYFSMLFLYSKFNLKIGLIGAYIIMAGIIFQILKWAVHIPSETKD